MTKRGFLTNSKIFILSDNDLLMNCENKHFLKVKQNLLTVQLPSMLLRLTFQLFYLIFAHEQHRNERRTSIKSENIKEYLRHFVESN